MASVVKRVLCLSVCLSVGLGSMNDGMNTALKNLYPHYEVNKLEGFNGVPVFSLDFLKDRNIEKSEKKVLMVGFLEVYEKMIGQMLNQSLGGQDQTTDSPNSSAQEGESEISKNLRYVLGEVRDLLEHKYQNSTLLKKQMLDLQNIKTNSTLIQKKALCEFSWLYQQASTLAEQQSG